MINSGLPTSERPKPYFIRIDPLEESTVSGLYVKDITQYLRLTKIMLRRYLEECIKEDGQFRVFFDKFATFTKGFIVNEDAHDDPESNHLQIVDFYSSARERPPQIFIQDNGYSYKPSGLGGLSEGWAIENSPDGGQIVRITDVVDIDIQFTCAALSVQEVEDLMAFLSAAFGQYQRFTCNYVLRPEVNEQGPNWEVRIPFTYSFSAKNAASMHNDPRIRIWTSTQTMRVTFENSSWMTYKAQPLVTPQNGSLTISLPDSLVVGQDHSVYIENYALPISVYTDDPRIALVRPLGRERWVVMPKRVGKCNVLVVRVNRTGKDDEIMASHELTVVAR